MLRLRVLSATAGVPLLLLCAVLGGVWYLCLVRVGAVLSALEVCSMLKLAGRGERWNEIDEARETLEGQIANGEAFAKLNPRPAAAAAAQGQSQANSPAVPSFSSVRRCGMACIFSAREPPA